MKMLLSSRGLFTLGFVILLATNIIVFSEVASNRSGNLEAQIILSERELTLPSRINSENSGLSLKITWRVLAENTGYDNYSGWRAPEWFHAEKLESLGFNVDAYDRSKGRDVSYKHPIPKEVFVVLEYNGDAYEEALNRTQMSLDKAKDAISSNTADEKGRKEVEKAAKRLKHEQFSNSRLFVIDTGLDPGLLRGKYKDQSRFIITKGLVSPGSYSDKNKKEITGYIKRLSIRAIHVPLKHRQVFDTLLDKGTPQWNSSDPPRYKIELGYGSRLEPWIVSVQQM